MEPILQLLDSQWPELVRSPPARRALIRWTNDHPVLEGMHDLQAVLNCRRNPSVASDVHRVLARLASTDELAARTLLQILLPGIVRTIRAIGYDDPDAADEMVALAWERICTYPMTRGGSVPKNVLLDVRKRYVKARALDRVTPVHLSRELPSAMSLPEDQVIAAMQLEEIGEAHRSGAIGSVAFNAVVRTRVFGDSLSDVAADSGLTTSIMGLRRWRAEQRIRTLPLAG